jgi:putative copper resistance protein D
LIWLLRDIDLLSTLLRAANLSFEALLLGGIAYLLVVARPAKASKTVESFCFRGIRWAALALAISELVTVILSAASLLGDSDLRLNDLISATSLQAGLSAALLAMLLWACTRVSVQGLAAMIPLSLLLLAAAVSTSHAVAPSGNCGVDRSHALPARFLSTR